ncbi:BTAD domain-containing putative transcriptional regulator [Streptomyces sp. NPDC056161]|uniref:AfsR/SARP family transcriptional regulator n=1 Tax=Streptomyces sp. NPDC056161 TaxID=3345732 RepID=UPI0035E00AA2
MRYEILGPPRITDGKTHSTINARKVEIVLSVLLIRAGHVVSLEQLMQEVWGEDLPRRATAGLHVYISQLRKFLKASSTASSRVETRAPGYVLHKGDDEIDAELFPRLVGTGRAFLRQKQHDMAVPCLEKALALWRGPALGHSGGGPAANGPIIDGFSTWLAECRLECQEMLAECQLHLGHHREAVGMLYALIAENPMREAFYRQLMLALYRSERRADALKVYQSVRQTLNDEMGLEPGRPLQALQRAILAGDKSLLVTPPVASGR